MYLVIGATGNVGSEVVNQLLSNGHTVRVFTRDAAKVAQWNGRVEIAIGDLTKPDTFAQAATGVEGVFLMNGVLDPTIFRQLIDTLKTQGTPKVVFLSSLFAAFPDSPIGKLHKDKEDVIRASGLPATFVRASGFMSNAFQWLGSIQSESAVYNSMGTGLYAPIAPEDIAAVAAHALTHSDPEILDVTGGKLVTVPEQVGILSDALHRPLRCVEVSIESAIQGLIHGGVPPHVAPAVAQTFQAIRDGRMATVTQTVQQITGRSPRPFSYWANQHAARFAEPA